MKTREKKLLEYVIAQKARAFQSDTQLELAERKAGEPMGDIPCHFDFAYDLLNFITEHFEIKLKPDPENVPATSTTDNGSKE